MFFGFVFLFSNMDNIPKTNVAGNSLYYLYTSPLLIGGAIVIFCRLTGKEEGEW